MAGEAIARAAITTNPRRQIPFTWFFIGPSPFQVESLPMEVLLR
jgi:hypothetical protein